MKDILKGVLYVALFAIPFIPLIVADTFFFPFITGKNFTFRILVEVAFTAWVLLALYDVKFRPRFSWVLAGLTTLIGVMFFANLFGEYQTKSFWSNFERMEGYVTLVHVFLLVITLGSALRTEKAWNWFLNTTLFSASILSIYAFGQIAGSFEISQGTARIDGTLGNAAYMAVYMLFHAFIALIMLVRTRQFYPRLGYGALALMFIYLLIQTATRGTAIGLIGGLVLAALYIAIFSRDSKQLRTYAFGGLVTVAVVVMGFVALKDSSFISENRVLSRISSISLEDGETRFQIWSMALEGVKERPVLGWGQGNFNYVFNKYYHPGLYAQEPWFDRVHNIVLDWLIAGGVVGFLSYASIFVASLYYLIYRPRFSGDTRFSVPEQGLFFGLLGAYFVHNMFVFDNIVSYIFFSIILACIHSRVGEPFEAIEFARIPERIINSIIAPVTVVVMGAVIYFVNAPGIYAAQDIINGFIARTPEQMLTAFETALSRNSFGNQEIREQLTQRGQQVARTEGVSQETREAIYARTEAELLKQIAEKPGDARVHVFVSAFYRGIGNIEGAREQLEIARSLSPQKQQIIFEQGFVEMQAGNFPRAVEFFKEAYELQENYRDARLYYAAALLYDNRTEEAEALITDEYISFFSQNQIAMNAAATAQAYDLLRRASEYRIEERPDNLQNWVSLAAVYYDSGDSEKSVEILREAIEKFPDFATQGESFIADINAGRKPGSTPVSVEDNGGAIRVNAQ